MTRGRGRKRRWLVAGEGRAESKSIAFHATYFGVFSFEFDAIEHHLALIGDALGPSLHVGRNISPRRSPSGRPETECGRACLPAGLAELALLSPSLGRSAASLPRQAWAAVKETRSPPSPPETAAASHAGNAAFRFSDFCDEQFSVLREIENYAVHFICCVSRPPTPLSVLAAAPNQQHNREPEPCV